MGYRYYDLPALLSLGQGNDGVGKGFWVFMDEGRMLCDLLTGVPEFHQQVEGEEVQGNQRGKRV